MKPSITTFNMQRDSQRGSVRPLKCEALTTSQLTSNSIVEGRIDVVKSFPFAETIEKDVMVRGKNNYLRTKQNILLILLCLGLLPAGAQKIIEKHIDFAPSGYVRMNFQISDSIRIITWKKNEVYIKSSINVNDNQNNDDYKMVFGESGNTINVSAKLELPKGACCGGKKDSSGRVIHSGGTTVSGDNDCCCCCNCHSQIFHEVYVPENADFSVETINGNITITGNTAEIRAKSISGYIDLAIAPQRKADLKMRTISGTMYSNIELSSTSRRIKQVGGGTVTAELNGGGGKEIDLETISGNIFFRKEG